VVECKDVAREDGVYAGGQKIWGCGKEDEKGCVTIVDRHN